MGTLIPIPVQPDPVPAGDPCLVCFGVRGGINKGETPESIQVTVWGVEHGPGWLAGDGELPDGIYILSQLPLLPCTYAENILLPFNRRISWGGGSTNFRLVSTGGVMAFRHFFAPRCALVFKNTITDKFLYGTATIQIPGIL